MRIIKRALLFVLVLFMLVGIVLGAGFLVNPVLTKQMLVHYFGGVVEFVLNQRNQDHFGKFKDYRPGPDEVWGIDLSHHQDWIDWSGFDDLRPHFVFLKATEGISHIDTRYRSHRAGFNKLGVPIGAYHFFSYRTDGKKQAIHFLKHAKIKEGDLLPVLDFEADDQIPERDWIVKNVKAFLNHVENETGYRPVIYTTCNFYKRYLKNELKGEYHYWICDYLSEPRCDYTFWQMTDRFKHDAFPGRIDLNTFAGDKSLLETFVIK